jgi:hypothetical protein
MIAIAKNFREKHFTSFVGIVTALVVLAALCSGVLPRPRKLPRK